MIPARVLPTAWRRPSHDPSGAAARCRAGQLALLLALALAGCGSNEPELVRPAVPREALRRASLEVAGRTVQVELAISDQERSRGLKHRTSLPPDTGMLFLFPEASNRHFWMQDTLIPLDIIFLDDDGRVLNVQHGRPGVQRPGYPSKGPARFVLEMAGGWCAEAGLAPGDRIEIGPELRELAR